MLVKLKRKQPVARAPINIQSQMGLWDKKELKEKWESCQYRLHHPSLFQDGLWTESWYQGQ